jgi:SM-20-related protein
MDVAAPELPAQLPAALATQGWCCCDDFISGTLVRALQTEVARRFERGEFRPAAVGTGAGRARRPEVRSDQICWVVHESSEPVRAVERQFESLRLLINRALTLGLFEHEVHFARYAPGAFYTRHVDTFAGSSSRIVSTVLYLNEQWQEDDGGALRLHLDEAAGEHVDVLPVAGRLVLFFSERFPHEVLPARRERWSLTGWYRTRGPI